MLAAGRIICPILFDTYRDFEAARKHSAERSRPPFDTAASPQPRISFQNHSLWVGARVWTDIPVSNGRISETMFLTGLRFETVI
jgi:hypothetical protein